MRTSDAILKWLDENEEWFKISAIAKRAGIDKGNFLRYRKAKDIPEKHLIPLMNIIIPLGFTLEPIIEENKEPILDEEDMVPEVTEFEPVERELTMAEKITLKAQEFLNNKNKKS